MEETQQILGELRALRRSTDEIALGLRIDTPWKRFQEHVSYALSVVRQVPMLSRLCLFFGMVAVTIGALYRNARMAFIGVDLLFASLMFVGGQPA